MLRRTSRRWTLRLVILLTLVALALLGTAPTLVQALSANPGILPPQSRPHGLTYGEWAAKWWQWALQTPASVNPILDLTGERCAEGQSGHVWFLGGTFGLTAPVARACTVPSGTSLFFPLLNAGHFAFLNDPPEQRTEEFLRAQVACAVPTELAAEIDGVPVDDPLQYFERSPLFDVQLPADNVLGLGPDVIPELRLSPSVDQGYYLFVAPLPPGEHTIQWRGSWTCPFGAFTEDVAYVLTVEPK